MRWSLILLAIFSYQASAGFYGEPLVNRLAGKWTQDIAATTPITGTVKGEGDISGFQYGGRLGYAWEGFNLGLQVSAAKGKEKSSKMTLTIGNTSTVENLPDTDFTRTDNGMVFGYKFGPLFRMWFSALNSQLKIKDSDGTTTKYKGVTGLLGFGWYVEHIISINLEVGGSQYSEEDGKKYPVTQVIDGETFVASEYKEALIFFGVSIPFGMY